MRRSRARVEPKWFFFWFFLWMNGACEGARRVSVAVRDLQAPHLGSPYNSCEAADAAPSSSLLPSSCTSCCLCSPDRRLRLHRTQCNKVSSQNRRFLTPFENRCTRATSSERPKLDDSLAPAHHLFSEAKGAPFCRRAGGEDGAKYYCVFTSYPNAAVTQTRKDGLKVDCLRS